MTPWSFAGTFKRIEEVEAETALEDERWEIVEPDEAEEGGANAA